MVVVHIDIFPTLIEKSDKCVGNRVNFMSQPISVNCLFEYCFQQISLFLYQCRFTAVIVYTLGLTQSVHVLNT